MIGRLRVERGFTLIEMLLASSLMIVVLGATLTVLDQFVSTSDRNTKQNEAQDSARFTIDRVTRELRNLALPTLQSPNSIDKASSYDLVFKTADPGRRRVRYCVQTTSPYSTSNAALWMQTQQQTSPGGADPAPPPTDTCPASGWNSTRLMAAHVTNENNADRPLFQFNPVSNDLSKITVVHASIFIDVDPTHPPAETRISSGVFLRNQNQAPSAAFTIQPGGSANQHIVMNAATSGDPEGRTLGYYWFLGATPTFDQAINSGTCDADDDCIATGVLADYTVPPNTTADQVFTLLVRDPGGLTDTAQSICKKQGSGWGCSVPS